MSQESLFQRVAREARLKAPGISAPQEAWDRHAREVYDRFPGWGYDRAFIHEIAAPFLPRVLAQMTIGRLAGFVSAEPLDALVCGIPLPVDLDRDWSWRWLLDHALRPSLIPMRAGPEATGMVFYLTPQTRQQPPPRRRSGQGWTPLPPHVPEPRLYLCAEQHDWRCPDLARQGDDLVDLGAWRWEVSLAKAAHRIARLAGAARAYP